MVLVEPLDGGADYLKASFERDAKKIPWLEGLFGLWLDIQFSETHMLQD